MEPISIIIMALVAGAAAAIKPTTEQAIKDAYAGIKALILHRYGNIHVTLLEEDPTSKTHQAVLKEDLEKTGAAQDEWAIFLECSSYRSFYCI